MLQNGTLSRCPKKHPQKRVPPFCHIFSKPIIGGTSVTARVSAVDGSQPLEIADIGV